MDRESAIITPGNKPFIATRFLPKTGQTTIYGNFDDGKYRKGWDIGDRFVPKTIGGDAVVFDRATGLMWPTDGSAAGCNNDAAMDWNSSRLWPEALIFAGYSDWRLPNIFELGSIGCFENFNPCLYPGYWINMSDNFYWTSTTFAVITSEAWVIYMGMSNTSTSPKTQLHRVMAVRAGPPG